MAFSNKEKLRSFFLNPVGEEILDEICLAFGVGTQSYTIGDPTATAFNEGRRYAALELLAAVYGPDFKAQDIVKRKYSKIHERMTTNV